MSCACGSDLAFKNCCEPFLKGEKFPETAEALMRSRYVAFTLADMKYIQKTLAPEAQTDFDAEENRKWAEQAKWRKLSIISTKKGGPDDTEGVVEFCAFYGHEDQELQHHEVAQFRKDKSGKWLFVDGDAHMHPADEDVETAHAKPETFVRTSDKIGRNDPCHCGSGKKFKKCCGN